MTRPVVEPPRGSVPMNRAMVCLDCTSIFFVGPTCPACASEQMKPLAAWLEKERTP